MHYFTHIVQVVQNIPNSESDDDANAQFKDVALVTLYSPPDEENLLAQSYGALLSCTKLSEDSFCVIEISLIQSVVAMIPHSIHSVLNDRYFLIEKTGMQIVHCGEEDASNTNTVQLLQ